MTEPSYRPRRGAADKGPTKPPASERLRTMLKPAPKGEEGPPTGGGPTGAADATTAAWRPESGWTLAEISAVLAVTVLVTVVENSLLNSDAVTSLDVSAAMVTRGVVIAVYYAILLAFVWWLTARRHRSFTEAVNLRSFDAGPAAVWIIGSLLVVRTAEVAYAYFVPAPQVDLTRLFGASVTGILVSVVLWGLVAPFVEEVVFRGVVLEGLADLMPGWLAILVSAALFAAVHFSAYLLVPFFVAGLALGVVARRTRSLWPAVILHGLYNLTSVLLAYLLHR